MIKLLHTADHQLGIKFSGFGEKGRGLRQAVKETLKATVDLALTEAVDLVLIAGDLFDSNAVSKNLVDETLTELKGLDPIPVCILPGTHDCYDASSVYGRPEFQHIPNIHVMTDEINSISFEKLDLTVYGRVNQSPKGTESPFAGLQKTDQTEYHIAMAHGEMAIEGKFSGDYYPIKSREIAESGMNYIALGHWHRYADFSQDPVKAFYCGAPETLSFEEGEDSGFVLLVSIDESGTHVEKKRVGKFFWKTIGLTIEDFENEDELMKEIRKYADHNSLLQVKLKGLKPVTWDVSEERLLEALGDSFFHLEFTSIDLSSSLEHIPTADFPETTIMGQFLRLMIKKIETADPTEKPVFEEALQRGFSLLNGREA
ncbi:MAG: DNA repair exonuclease [Desulfobacterales bacterium]|nr:DNA repair exonuclease [Desulfobacterales bacterium]